MSPPPGQVPDLVARVAAGDREAIVELLARYRARLRRMVALRLDPRLQGRVDASDVIQEGYLDAIKRLGKVSIFVHCASPRRQESQTVLGATFEQWLEFVFNNPVRKREWYWDEDFDSRWEALELTDALIVQYMTRLFLEPGVLRSYSFDQVEQGLWFLLGEASPGRSSKTLLMHEAALVDRVACIRAMSGFFRNFILAVTPGHFDPKAPTVGVTGAAISIGK